MKNKLMHLTLLIFVLIGIIYIYQKSYARYIKKSDNDVNANVATWNIKINNEDITSNKTLTNDIIPVFPGNDYVNPNVIAPGVIGYFDILIDATKTQVPFKWEITSEENEIIPDLKIVSYTIDPENNNNKNLYKVDDPTIDNILIGAAPTKTRIYIQWVDEGTTSNKEDTDISKINNVTLKINIKLTQIIE